MNHDSVKSGTQGGDGLDPRNHPDRWEGLVARINEAAKPLLVAREPLSLTQVVAGWRSPLLLGSVGLVAAAMAALMLYPQAEAEELTLASAVMPRTVAAWMEGSYSPTVEELMLAVGEAQAGETRP